MTGAVRTRSARDLFCARTQFRAEPREVPAPSPQHFATARSGRPGSHPRPAWRPTRGNQYCHSPPSNLPQATLRRAAALELLTQAAHALTGGIFRRVGQQAGLDWLRTAVAPYGFLAAMTVADLRTAGRRGPGGLCVAAGGRAGGSGTSSPAFTQAHGWGRSPG